MKLTQTQIDALIAEHSEWTPQGSAIVDSHRRQFARALLSSALAAEGGEASDKQEAVAWVPIDPVFGPVWMDIMLDLSHNGGHRPVKPLYFAAPATPSDKQEAVEEREQFEAWATQKLGKIANESLAFVTKETFWEVWLARAALAPAQPSGWQPIATAPKTGRRLLLGYRNVAGNWRTVRGQWMSESYIAEYWEDPDDAEPGWFETSEEAEDVPNCWRIEPSHWMHLTAAPSPTKEQTPASSVASKEEPGS